MVLGSLLKYFIKKMPNSDYWIVLNIINENCVF